MKRPLQIFAAALVAHMLIACMNYEALIKKVLSADIDSLARRCIEDAANGNIEPILNSFPPQQRESIRPGLQQLSASMQKGGLIAVRTAHVQAYSYEGRTTYNVHYELQYPHAWQYASLALVKTNDAIVVAGFHVSDLKDSLTVLNRFTFKDKTASHYLFLVLNLLYLAIVVTAFAICIRTKGARRKWLWAIVCLVGAVEFSFNWSTGAWAVNPLSIGFRLSDFFPPSPYLPPTLVFYLPVGAIVFLTKHGASKSRRGATVS